MSSYRALSSEKVPDGTATFYGFDKSFLKNKALLTHAKGFILFVHGFNSSAQIWGDESSGFVSSALEHQFIPFVIDFSNATSGSIINLANHDLFLFFKFVQEFIQNNIPSKHPLPIHFVAHSMGGVITRFFLSTTTSHVHHTASELKNSSIKSIALLGVPNHGISKSNSENFISKMQKIINDFNAITGPKHTLKLVDKAYFQLLSGNSVINSLLDDLSTNMWPELFWMNFIAQRDIVVDRISSLFDTDEVEYLGSNFVQKEFDATHMQNPFQTFTDAISKKIPFSDNKFLSSIEFKKPDFLSYIINQPIYANKELLKDYFELIEYL